MTESALPSARDGVFYHRASEGSDVAASGGVLDWDPGFEPDLSGFTDDVAIAADAGRAGAGSAIVAGFGLGWWRDPRPIWRKRRPARPRAEWEAARAAASTHEDLSPEESE